ncbi:trypsin-like serine protease [Streptomyces sp. NPDC001373]|uniref:trypsin-like serine protease n=1 Tax=Streptomyces sp. NPDC001373 TaxID=3364565 RepID=UPI0036A9B63E
MHAPRPRTAQMTCLLAAAAAVAAGLISAGPAQALNGPDATAGQYTSVVKLNVGGETNSRGCTGALVDASWVLTAASCFAATPGDAVPAGKPALKSVVTLGDTKTIEITELAPRTDRDLVLARLATPAAGFTGIKRAGAAPATGTDLTAAGFGRTKTEWVPGRLHTGTFTAGAIGTTTLTLSGKGTDVLCKGDTGGPLLNRAGELVGINSRSWQGGCLDTDAAETRTGAVSVRTDDLREWIDGYRARSSGWKTATAVQSGSSLYQGIRLPDGSWTGFADVQSQAGSIGGVRSSAVVGMNGDTHVLAISNNGGLFHTIRKEDGTWGTFGDVFGEAGALANLTSVTAANIGYDLHVVAVADGKVFHTVRNAAGQWSKFGDVAGAAGPIGNVTAAATASTGGQLQVTAISGGKAYHTLRNTAGQWTGWGDVAAAVGSTTGPISAVTMAGTGNDAQIVIATDDGTHQYHAIRNGNGTWTPFGDLKPIIGTVTAKSIAAAPVNGELQFAVTTADNKVLHTTRHTDRTWDAPTTVPLQGLPAAPGSIAITPTWTP